VNEEEQLVGYVEVGFVMKKHSTNNLVMGRRTFLVLLRS
jgi:hypothetical protein